MSDVPPRSLEAAANVVEWIWEEESLEGRLQRIQHFLENEGYPLPEPPRGVDRSEEGDTHIVRGRRMTVEYAVVDQGGRKVYHYRENEIDHIMLRRIEKYDEWALEHLSLFPHILKAGKVISEEPEKVIYQTRQLYRFPGGQCPLRLIIKRHQWKRWYIDTFYPWYRKANKE
jgi:hypothetical protein